ncbi:acyl-CoA synthetase [Hydrogenophaga sp. T2]|uniref:LpxL/LpxP family acyltransferase n=1 Tax=Hydrogenophaga sp. T2 TaxID=3132823 RepID=UPI003CEEC323
MTQPGAARPDWRNQPERSNAWLLRFMVRLSLLLGRSLSRVVLHGATAYFVLFAPRARRASRDYLARVLGRPAHGREVYRHLFSFATTVHDRVFLLNDRFDLFDIEIEGGEALLQAMKGGQGVLLMGAHLGSFEVLRCVGRRHPDIRVAMMMFEDNARKVADALRAINPDARQDVVALGQPDSMIEASRRLEQGQLVGLLVDRSLTREDRVPHDFLGAPAGFPLAPWHMATVLRAPVFFMAGLYLGGRRYRLVFEPIADLRGAQRAQRAAQSRQAQADYVRCLQAHCRAAPYNWFNFFDFWNA